MQMIVKVRNFMGVPNYFDGGFGLCTLLMIINGHECPMF